MDNKTKDALKQLQAEMRHLQALIAEGSGGRKAEGESNEEPAAAGKGKSESLVQYTIHRSSTGDGAAPVRTVAAAVTATQIAKVTDEAAATLGYALSSPQKVALLRALLARESESAAVLGVTAHLSTGSLYHHLRDLMHARLIAQAGRNQYHLTDLGRRALLLLLALASEA